MNKDGGDDMDEPRFRGCEYCDGGHVESDCPDNPYNPAPKIEADKELERILFDLVPPGTRHRLKAALLAWRDKRTDKVDRFEVIDEDGRAYVRGSIYGSPVSVELSYQDDGRTLKVFVKPRPTSNGAKDEH